MLLQLQLFERQYLTRRRQHIFNPLVFPVIDFKFPRNSTYHHTGLEDGADAPDLKSSMFRGMANKIIYMQQVTELPEDHSKLARKLAKPPVNLYRNYYRTNSKRVHISRDISRDAKDENVVAVMNYGYIHDLYAYAKLPLQSLERYYDLQKALWTNVNNQCDATDRNQFVFLNLPKILPGRTVLNLFVDKYNTTMLEAFSRANIENAESVLDIEKLNVLEMWKWLSSDHSSKSVLSRVKTKNLSKVYLVFISNERWFTIKMSSLVQLRKDFKDPELSESKDLAGMQFNSDQVQKLFLRMCLRLQTFSTEEDLEVSDDTQDEKLENDEDLDDESEDTEVSSKPTNPTPEKETSTENPVTDINDTDDIVAFNVDIDKTMEDIEADIAVLDKLDVVNKVKLEKKLVQDKETEVNLVDELTNFSEADSQAIRNQVYTEVDPVDALKSRIDSYTEYGIMTATEYRALSKQAEIYNTSANPYDAGIPVKDYVKLTEKDININTDKTVFKDSPTVLDKSLLKSVVQEFDAHYIKNVMSKNVVAMISNIQKSGVVIQEHIVEQEESILGDYEMHTLKLKPIDGAASTIRFRLPKVNEYGVYQNGGNLYTLRKQRCDVPIRKIDSRRVGITSYYGKVFVQRNAYKANTSIDWIANQINMMSNDVNNQVVKNIGPANVFDSYFKSPKIYSALSTYYKTITLNNILYIFDHKERLKLFNSEEECKAIENNKYVVVGKDNKGIPIVVGYDDIFYKVENGQYTVIGNIYQQLGLDEQKAPIDFAELQVFAKTIPIGLVLSYFVGFSKMIKMLGIKVKVLDSNKRAVLEPHEFVVKFRDKQLIISKRDKLASLVMGGFVNYAKTIKGYDLDSFNDPAVYLNVLESNGITARSIRELDLMNQLFVDPITKEILAKMKEPVTFIGLLIRGTEMLLLDHHPASQDMNFMRIRGYERFSGAVYKELVNSIRDYQSKNIRGKAKIDMSPYAVSMNIGNDTSAKLVEDINPIQNMKEHEAVTYSGEGGRNKDANIKSTRAYHKTDMGTISEATVDSSDVGVNTYLSYNPKLTDVFGMTERFESDKDGIGNLYSASAMASPFATRDDKLY